MSREEREGERGDSKRGDLIDVEMRRLFLRLISAQRVREELEKL